MNIFKRIISGWTPIKMIRVIAGGLILYSSIESGIIAGIILGVLFTTFSLLTGGGCCITNFDDHRSIRETSSINETIEYEELGAE